MPAESEVSPTLKALQRELADSIIRRVPLDELRILLACGAKVNEPVTQGLRPLHYATYQRYEKAVSLLLVRGCDVNAMDDVGYTALHLCAERGYAELMKLLVQHNARVKFTQLNDDKALGNPPRTTMVDEPLRLAIKNGHLECAEFLLKSGADANARYFLGSEINLISPLNVMCLELLLKFGSQPDCRDRSGLTPLMKACRHPQGYAAAKILIHYNADVNAITSERHDYRSVLHYAVLSHNIDIVRLLLHHGANARYIFPTPAAQKPTPLDFAILSGNVQMVKLLIDAGADVNVGSPIIGRPLHIVLSEKTPNKCELIDLLLEAGADPNAITTDSRRPLLKPPIGEYFNASHPPHIAIVRKLLKYGARVIIKAQVHNSIGILKVINRLELERDHEVLRLVMEAAESFNIAGIKRCTLLSESVRQFVLEHATRPQPLAHQSRVYVRKLLTELALHTHKRLLLKQKNRQKAACAAKSAPLYKAKPGRATSTSMSPSMDSNDSQLDDEEALPTSEGYESQLDDQTIHRLNQMTLDEIEDEFSTGGNGDPERLKLLTALLRRTSAQQTSLSVPNSEVIERIKELPLPEVMKSYLNYEISFPSIEHIINL